MATAEPRLRRATARVPAWQVVPCPPERLDDLFRLRASVWIRAGADPAAFPGGLWRDARDAERQHWIALSNDEVVGCASFSVSRRLGDVHQAETYRLYGIPEGGPIGCPGRLVIHEDWRGRGIVQQLLDRQDAAAREAGAVIALRQASHMLVPMLRRRGWRLHGPAIADARFPGEDFSVMSLDLAAG